MLAARVVVVGSANMDLVFRVREMPAPGETVEGTAFTAHGGKGANQAVAASRLGASTMFLGAVGRDAHGAELRDGLAAEGVDVSRVLETDEPTGSAMILVDDAGRNSIVVALGANLAHGPGYVRAHGDAVEAGSALLLQLEVRNDTVDEAIAIGRQAGALVVLDAAPAREVYPSRLAEVDVLSPNERETVALLRCPPLAGLDDAKRAASRLRALGPRIVGLKLGDQGAVIAWEDRVEHVAAIPVAAVDTTACGDAWTAAFAVALCEGAEPLEAARFAAACGALAATKLGAQPSLPTRAEVAGLLAP